MSSEPSIDGVRCDIKKSFNLPYHSLLLEAGLLAHLFGRHTIRRDMLVEGAIFVGTGSKAKHAI